MLTIDFVGKSILCIKRTTSYRNKVMLLRLFDYIRIVIGRKVYASPLLPTLNGGIGPVGLLGICIRPNSLS